MVVFSLVLYFLFQLFTLPYVGMTWDEPSSFFFGRATLRFYFTGDRGYLAESEWRNPDRFGDEPFQYIYGEDVYPPFPFVFASLISLLFAETVPLMRPDTAHHFGLLLLGMCGVFAIHGIGRTLGWSRWLATGIALLYATYPTIIGHMRNDAKDLPLMSMIVVFVFFMIRWMKTNHPLFAVGSGVALGLALGSKPTAAILPIIFFVFFFVSILLFPSWRKTLSIVRLLAGGAFIGIVGLGIFFLSWPWLWDDPIGKLFRVWEFFRVVGRGMPTLYFGSVYQAGINLPWHYPFGILAVQTPEATLVLGMIAFVVGSMMVLRRTDPWALFFLLWIAIGMGRFFLPGVIIYAKVRHFIDVMPAFFVLIGMALHGIEQRRWGKHIARGVLCIAILQHIWVIGTHVPYEPSYFNTFVGGTKGAAEGKLFDVEYWASAVREGMMAVDRGTRDGEVSRVYACTMAHLALFYETPRVKVVSDPAFATHTLVPNSASWFGGVTSFMNDRHDVFYTLKRAGGELFWVYRHTNSLVWHCGNETDMVYER